MAVTLVSGCSMFALSSRAPHSVRVRFNSLRNRPPLPHPSIVSCLRFVSYRNVTFQVASNLAPAQNYRISTACDSLQGCRSLRQQPCN